MDTAITPLELKRRLAAFPPPTLVDLRREVEFDDDPRVIPAAIRRVPQDVDAWASPLEPWRMVVVYCVRGHEVSQNAASALRARGLDARYLEGGIEQWRAEGLPTQASAAPTRWVTRERPKIDRIACPWLVRRFIDPAAEFFYVLAAEVRGFAEANHAEPYDVPDVRYTHAGRECSFDAFVRFHDLDHPALTDVAAIVRGADTGRPELAPEAPGLLTVSRGLSTMFVDDHQMLKWGMLVYDSLYAQCREAKGAAGSRFYPESLRTPEDR
jgi:rhodanese-related sulfurtransferase